MFTYNIQLAGYDFEQTDEKGNITLEEFKKVLYDFPWLEQVKRSSEIKEGASATVSVVNHEDNTILWVSIAGDEHKSTFLVGYVFNKAVKGLLGFGKAQVKRWVDIYKVGTLDEVMSLFDLYFSKRNEELISNLFLEEKFHSMAITM